MEAVLDTVAVLGRREAASDVLEEAAGIAAAQVDRTEAAVDTAVLFGLPEDQCLQSGSPLNWIRRIGRRRSASLML